VLCCVVLCCVVLYYIILYYIILYYIILYYIILYSYGTAVVYAVNRNVLMRHISVLCKYNLGTLNVRLLGMYVYH